MKNIFMRETVNLNLFDPNRYKIFSTWSPTLKSSLTCILCKAPYLQHDAAVVNHPASHFSSVMQDKYATI